jgi:hypothetical protein
LLSSAGSADATSASLRRGASLGTGNCARK